MTLVELLVSLTIASLALALVVGTVSTGLIDATLVKRNTGIQAVMEYEMEQVSASTFTTPAAPFSDCFATERPSSPAPASGGYQGACSSGYSLRADVTCQPTCSSAVQTWTIAVSTWPASSQTGFSVQVYKVTHT